MTYLTDPSKIALAIGAKCGGTITSDNEGILSTLELLLPRVEDAMNVASLTWGETTDTFQFPAAKPDQANETISFRLSNGYVANSQDHPIVITDSYGNAATVFSADLRYGVVAANGLKAGTWTIRYFAGFDVPVVDPDVDPPLPVIFAGVPAWIDGLIVALLVLWYRTEKLNPMVPQNYRYGELIAPLRREVYARIYGRYMRPRFGVEFPSSSVRTDGMNV
jgi:hypothetical protein